MGLADLGMRVLCFASADCMIDADMVGLCADATAERGISRCSAAAADAVARSASGVLLRASDTSVRFVH